MKVQSKFAIAIKCQYFKYFNKCLQPSLRAIRVVPPWTVRWYRNVARQVEEYIVHIVIPGHEENIPIKLFNSYIL